MNISSLLRLINGAFNWPQTTRFDVLVCNDWYICQIGKCNIPSEQWSWSDSDSILLIFQRQYMGKYCQIRTYSAETMFSWPHAIYHSNRIFHDGNHSINVKPPDNTGRLHKSRQNCCGKREEGIPIVWPNACPLPYVIGRSLVNVTLGRVTCRRQYMMCTLDGEPVFPRKRDLKNVRVVWRSS